MSKCRESICVYGGSGVGKTHQVGDLGDWVARNMKKQTRLVSASGGGWTTIQPLVDLGVVVPTYIRNRRFPFQAMERFSKGWWPEDPSDPMSPLIPPEKQKDWDMVGAVAYDGLSEMCEWLMSTSVQREAKGEIKISTESLAARFSDGDVKANDASSYGTPGKAHYLVVQNHATDCVTWSKGIPDRYILWTMLELRASDDVTKMPIYGPQVIGRAKTSDAAAWFEDTINLSMVRVGQSGMTKHRMWLTRHYDGDDPVPYLAKVRATAAAPLPPFLEGPECSLGVFLDLLHASQEKAKEIYGKRYEEYQAEIVLHQMTKNKT